MVSLSLQPLNQSGQQWSGRQTKFVFLMEKGQQADKQYMGEYGRRFEKQQSKQEANKTPGSKLRGGCLKH